MDWFEELLHNQVLINGVLAWALAQFIKALVNAFVKKKFSFERLFGDGGFPSGHSATVTAAATTSAFIYGLGSFEFAVTAILAIIIMHDASGVRRETGKQAAILNDILELFERINMEYTTEERLKELVGHTHVQVFAGALLGFLVGLLLH